jgi:signal transduction histidine kinase
MKHSPEKLKVDTDALLMERTMFQNLLDLNPYGIAIWDEDGRYVRSNQAYVKLFKRPPPKFLTLFDSPPLKKAGIQEQLLKLKEGVTLHLPPFWHNSRDVGEEYPDNPICIGAVTFPLMDRRGKIRYYVTMFEDVTQRVLAEERLKEALKFKSDFMATISHELRTPLSGIISSAALILQDRSLQMPARRTANVKNILGNADKLVLMINNILDVARMETGGTHVTPQHFSIAEMIKTSIELFHGLIDEKSLEVSWDVDPDMPMLFSDIQMIGQIVNNLVGNAVKYTDSGSIRIRAQVDEKDPDIFVISVKDTGIGIPKDMFDKIFENFSRVDSSTTRKYYGIGMGLSIVRGYVNLLGGKIKVESELMQGSNFTVTLPITFTNHTT